MCKGIVFSAAAVLGLIVSVPAAGGQFVEGFESGNEGSWSWGAADSIPAFGGNPDAYLRTSGLDTPAPKPRTTANDSIFLGNYRELGVSSISADFITFNQATTGGRPMTLMLLYDNGTATPTDDTAAYFLGPNVPNPGQGWVTYNFDIPSEAMSVPPGWQMVNWGDISSPPIHDWNQVIQNVTQVQFHYGDPTFFFIFQLWILGMDNVTIEFDQVDTPGDVNGDGVVNVEDLTQIILQWGVCDPPPATCSGDLNGDMRVNVEDLTEVILNWG